VTVPKYRKKPVAVDAAQWWPPTDRRHVPIQAVKSRPAGEGTYQHISGLYHYVETLEGGLAVFPGDWIITGIKGENYPCRDDIFRETYEPVEEGE